MTRLVSFRTSIKGAETHYLPSGEPTMLAVPYAESDADLRAADIAFIGIPQGSAASPGRDPAEWSDMGKGPLVTRRQSMRYTGFLPEHDLDVFEHLAAVDMGDAAIDPGDPKVGIDSVMEMVGRALKAGCRVVTLGGSVPAASYAVACGMARATAGKVGILSLDAHGDAFDDIGAAWGRTEPGAGTWQRRMWEHAQNIDPARHAEIGMRGPRNDRETLHLYRSNGALVFPASEVAEAGMAPILAKAIPHVMARATAGVDRTWVSLCMDVLDMGEFPDWGDEPLGLSARDVVRAIHESAKAGTDVLSIQFVAPDTPYPARLAVYLCVYQMAGWILGGHLPRRR
jgi:arginase family enzyme